SAAWLHLLRREEQLAREQTEEVMTLATEQGFPFWVARGMVVRGSALVEQGQVEEGIAQIHQGLAAYQAIGTETDWPYYLAWLAAACARAGRIEEGLSVVTEALASVAKTEARFNEAELYRLKGELTRQRCKVQSSKVAEAEEYFWKAIEIAQRQQAKSLELRAVMSLSRLWQQQDKRHEAHKLLSEIYSWFTEGFDTKDLQEAKALLAELRAAA